MEYLREHMGELEPEFLDYCTSIAKDSSMDESEKSELLSEYLLSVNDAVDCASIASEFVRLCLTRAAKKSTISQITDDALAACLDVIRAPEVQSAETDVLDGACRIDAETRKQLLKRYDDDATIAKSISAEDDEQDEIMGLGRNENRLRIVREREELRVRAKQEQEDAQAERVAQKLKSQGESLKSRTVNRRK